MNPVIINGEKVDSVENYKYLGGTVIDPKLNGSENILRNSKKANKRLYFVRKLKKVGVDKSILSMFYQSTVEAIICSCILCWYANSSSNDRKKLNRIIKSAKRLSFDVRSWQEL